MGTCPKCNREVLLKGNESKCPNCGEEVEYHCESCAFNFQVKGQKQCTWCGFYFCPECGSCSKSCEGEYHGKKIMPMQNTIDVVQYFGGVLHRPIRRNCHRLIPVSYAKGKLQSYVPKLQGKTTKSPEDTAAYLARHAKIINLPIGTTWTVSQLRENGSHGQEMREDLWLGVCEGYIKAEEILNTKTNKEAYPIFTRIEKIDACPYLNPKRIITFKCPRCKKQSEQKVCNICKYQKGIKKGQPVETIERESKCLLCELDKKNFRIKTDHE